MKQRWLTVVLLAGCVILGVVTCIMYTGQDRKPPVISTKKVDITYREGDNYSTLLEGVTAEDNRDGDLTDQIFVDKIVPIEGGRAVVYYGVMDKKKNVGTATRIVTYESEDGIEQSGTTGDDAENTNAQQDEKKSEDKKAEDKKKAEEQKKAEENQDDLTPEGEIPVIALNTDHVSIPVGSEFDPLSAVKGVADTFDDADTLSQQISVEGDYDINTPGDYTLSYFVTDSDGNTSEVKTLTLTVKEGE
ncbi:MAG: DUF5011 domain-containing protein [Faecalicatena sp.]|uniref:immunoglobulin-like domain-containing protein n=1 Tax=Faecalicatena sp. TaxID=2005360 RepID=UPI0025852CA6|nr:immunoglobulin-like domain-containing protein [Faecalicatena sp.]MCI6466412.1 DUF5011 domain-containing protein [Faecalicatena sp.]MCI7180553.1 DUF5011 domain-containing protein [Lachnospiraceae bacterium]MDY5619849.1 DUF5011 domain-containing protein [Lachnospiraceae bacterium]